MPSIRSKLPSARTRFAAILLAILALLTLPGAATAAPEGEEGPPAPQLSFEPSSYDFGLVRLNGETEQEQMRLRNVGLVSAQVQSFSIAGGSGAFWTGQSECVRTLGPGESCWIQVFFRPYQPAPFAAQLHAYAEGGIDVSADLGGEGGRASFEAAVNPVNFGAVPVGAPAVTRVVEVTNTGNMAGGAFIAVVSGGAVGSFHLLDENCTGVLMTPAASCDLVVSFQPLSSGAKSARLSLFGEEDGGAQVILSGIGLDPEPAAPVPPVSSTPASGRHSSRPHRNRGLRGRRLRAAIADRRALSGPEL
jgi:hypothetical protein